jgi:two-component system, sensor histidine kinase
VIGSMLDLEPEMVVSRARYLREKQARETAERLLEAKSRELYLANQRLRDQAKDLEATVADRTLELAQALDFATAATAAKSAFLANMSHEIRTPLNGVLGMAQAMASGELNETQRERLEIICQSGQTLLSILDDLLDLSKVEAGRMELEAVDFDLLQTVERAVAGFQAVAAAKGLRLVVDAQAVAGVCRGDPTRFSQILGNLVSNAVKFTDAGEVRVTTAREGDLVRVAVEDTGPGIEPKALARLFEKFVQADSTTTRRFGGTGLGLAICRELTQLMGGDVQAASEVGRGACFTFWLPLPWVGDANNTLPAREPDRVPADLGLRILAADDNVVNQQVLKTILEQVGLTVTLVSDGAQAVEAFKAHRWDLILMDVQMPVMDGPHAARAIREIEQRDRLTRTPIAALTANAMAHQKAEYLSCGMDCVVAKPIQIHDLFAAIETLLLSSEEAASAGERPEARLGNNPG